MNCPKCRKDLLPAKDGAGFCTLCGELFSKEQIDTLIKTMSALSAEKFPLDLNGMPSFLAIPADEYLKENNPVIKLHRMCDAVDILARFLAICGIAEIRGSSEHGELPSELLEILQPDIENPCPGKWLELIEKIANIAGKTDFPVLKELPGFVKNSLVPFSEVQSSKPEHSVLRLCTDFTNSAVTHASANAFLEIYKSRFSDLWSQAAFLSDLKVFYNGDPISGLITGPSPILKLYKPDPDIADKLDTYKGRVIIIRAGEILDLWPMCDYERAESHSPVIQRKAKGKSPMIYNRSELGQILFSVLGAELPMGESRDALPDFRSLFFPGTPVSCKNAESLDFKNEFHKQASGMIGRVDEIRKAKLAIKTVQTGVLWLTGPGGTGKSMLMAKLATDLDNDPERICLVPYRFGNGDIRCSREKFLRSAIYKISRWTEQDSDPEDNLIGLERQFDRLLRKVSALEPANPRARAKRILFMIDGMDEIVRRDPGFAEFPFHKSCKNVVWVCAGRPERGLPDIFCEDRCTPLVGSGGLPKMNAGDIRGMLLDKTGMLKYELLARDREQENSQGKNEIVNSFISEVAKKSDGLPLYLKFVIDDILSGDMSFNNENLLPNSLSEYYGVIIKRLSDGGLYAILKLMVAIIAQAEEPLCEEMLNTLLVRCQVLSEDEKGMKILQTALREIHGMLKTAPASENNSGYLVCHDTLRQYIKGSKELAEQNRLAAKMFEDFIFDWKNLPEGVPYMYALRRGPGHMNEAGQWDKFEDILTDLHFFEARYTAGILREHVRDCIRALNTIPEASEEKKKEQYRENQVRKYTRELIGLSKGEVQALEIISSANLLSKEKTDQNCILSNWIQAFLQFIGSEYYNLVKYGNYSGFIIQHAYNSAGFGPLADITESFVNKTEDKIFLLHHHSQRDGGKPHPGLLKTLEGHRNRVTGVSIIPDGKTAVSAGWDNSVCLWDLETGKCLKMLKGHTEFIESVSITPDGKTAVSGGEDNTLRAWDLETGQCVKTLKGHTSYVESVSLTPDGKIAVSASKDNSICVWDLETGECLKILEGHNWDYSTSPYRVRHMAFFKKLKNISSVTITPDGKTIVSGSDDKTVRVWDLETGQCVKILEGHTQAVDCISITPDSKTVISGSYDNTLRVWDLETEQCVKVLEGHTGPVYCADITADGKIAISGNEDKTLRVWNLETGECLMVLEGHTGPVYSVSMTPDGKTAVSGGWDNSVCVWNLQTRECVNLTERHAWDVTGVSVTPDGKTAVSGSHDKTLRIWNTQTGQCLKKFEGHRDFIESADVTPDGKIVISGSDDKTLRVWDMETGECLKILEGHTSFVETVIVRPDGKTALSAGYDDSFRAWDLETGNCLKIIELFTPLIKSISITPDGRAAVLANSDNVLYILHLKTGKCLNTLIGHTRDVADVCITPDGKTVVSASYDETLRLWDIETGECLNVLEGHTDSVNCVRVTPDGKTIISAGADRTIRVWDIIKGNSVCIYLAKNALHSLSEIRTGLSFAYGTPAGEVMFPIFRNFKMGTPVTTPGRIWLFGENGKPGKWEDDIMAHCWWCGRRFPVPENIADAINNMVSNADMASDQSPCIRLTRETWDKPELKSECSFCHNTLKFNPFIVDNSEEPDLIGTDEINGKKYSNILSAGLVETLSSYEIIKPLGKTSMGMIYLGRDMVSDRIVAIKTLRIPDRMRLKEAENLKMKFFRESESAGTLSHQNIVTIYGAGEEHGVAYIVMEFIDGGDLLKFTKRNNLLPTDKVVEYVADIANALDYMHQQGIVHRDIKPSNVMLLNTGQVKIADFGVAETSDQPGPDRIKITDFGVARIVAVSETEHGVVKGTPQYMSPEQISGEKVDGRSDIFSLGIMLYQLLTGRLPFKGNTHEAVGHGIMNKPHTNPKEINPELLKSHEFIINKALEKDREKRYQRGNEMASHLRALKVIAEQ
ncbi:MAG: protein kinase [Desulfobacteraceae bacterium]|nr:protein kinase [Desulfobacteraceae bacterium]